MMDDIDNIIRANVNNLLGYKDGSKPVYGYQSNIIRKYEERKARILLEATIESYKRSFCEYLSSVTV